MVTVEELETIREIAKTGITLFDTNVLYFRDRNMDNLVVELLKCERLKDVPHDAFDRNIRYTTLLRRLIEEGNIFFVDGVGKELEDFLGAFNGGANYLSGRARNRWHINERVSKLRFFKDGIKSLLKTVKNCNVDHCFNGEQRERLREIKQELYGESKRLGLKGNGDYEKHTDEDIAASAFLLHFVNNSVTNVVSLDRHAKSLIRFLFEDGLEKFSGFVTGLQPAETNGRRLELHGYKEESLCCLERYC